MHSGSPDCLPILTAIEVHSDNVEVAKLIDIILNFLIGNLFYAMSLTNKMRH